MTRILLLCFLCANASFGQGSEDLTDEQLRNLINGWTIEGHSLDELNSELAGDSADALMERVMGSEILRPSTIALLRYLKRGPSRDKAIWVALSDESNWTVHMEITNNHAYHLAYPAVANELEIEESPGANAILALCFMTPEGRNEMSRILDALFKIPQDQRTTGNPKFAALHDRTLAAISRYGTDEHVRGLKKSAVEIRPEKKPSAEESPQPSTSDPSTERESDTLETNQPLRTVSLWAMIGSVVLLAAAFARQLRRKDS